MDNVDNYLWTWNKFTQPLVRESFSCVGDKCSLRLSDGTEFEGSLQEGLVHFYGIPYAEAPIGNLRLRSKAEKTVTVVWSFQKAKKLELVLN